MADAKLFDGITDEAGSVFHPITPTALLDGRLRDGAARVITFRAKNDAPMISSETVNRRAESLLGSAQFSNLQFSSAHLVGVAGSGMKALAELLLDLGWTVTGSDLLGPGTALRSLKQRGLRVHTGHDRRFMPAGADVLVYSPAVGRSNPERRLAERLGMPTMSYSQMLGHLMHNRIGVAVAGTHGKSTTTAMTGTILTDAGLSPSVIVGAELCGRGRSGWAGTGPLFVVESCEYQRSFLDLRPRYGAILGVEADHFDYYKSFDETVTAFCEFASRVAPDGLLLVRGDCSGALAAAEATMAEVATFSLQYGSDWWAGDIRRSAGGARFRVFFRGDFIAEMFTAVPGMHNVLNALAATALCHYAGASAEPIRESLAEFRGIRRRFERIGSYRGVTLLDDYAHHPTAIMATLQAARQEFGSRRIWCAFQPHQVSRTQALLTDFAASFHEADEILIAPIFAARETPGDEAALTAGELASRIAKNGHSARVFTSLDRIVSTLDDEARPGDVLITMGAGDIDRVHNELTRRLRRHHAAR